MTAASDEAGAGACPADEIDMAERRRRAASVLSDYLGLDDALDAGKADPFARAVMPILWGEIWGRPGLSLDQRSMITIAALLVLDRTEELRIHIAAARRLGTPRETIEEVILHLGFYAGIPLARKATIILKDVYGAATPQKD